MPNWKKVAVSGSAASFSSLTVDTSVTASIFSGSTLVAKQITGSLFGTASFAVSSSRTVTSSFSISSSLSVSSSFALTASYALSSLTSSFAATASSVNTLNQAVVISGSLGIAGNAGTTIFNSNADTLVFSGSAQYTGSFGITGSLSVTQGITGSLLGTASTASYVTTAQTASYVTLAQTASYVASVVSSSYALTASYALNGGGSSPGVGSSVFFTQATASTTWVFEHNLGGTYVTMDVYDGNNNIIIPQNINATDADTLTITFSVPTSGHAVATVGGGLPAISASFANYTLQVNSQGTAAAWQASSSSSFAVSASYAVTSSYASAAGFNFEQSSPSNTWTINHNLNNLHPLVQVYDSSNVVLIPQSISSSNSNTTIISFSYAASGYARVV